MFIISCWEGSNKYFYTETPTIDEESNLWIFNLILTYKIIEVPAFLIDFNQSPAHLFQEKAHKIQ